MATNSILAVGHDPLIASTRSSVLRGAGYAVESATSAEQAIDRFRSQDFDLVILCHTIPLEERRCLARLIRASRSFVPVLYVQPLVEPSTDGLADAIIGSHPNELLSGVEEALNQAAASLQAAAKRRDEILGNSKKKYATNGLQMIVRCETPKQKATLTTLWGSKRSRTALTNGDSLTTPIWGKQSCLSPQPFASSSWTTSS